MAALEQQVLKDLALSRNLAKEFKGYKCYFYDCDVLHVVIFGKKVRLDPKEEEVCIYTAEKGVSSRSHGVNGFKTDGTLFWLKTKSEDSLVGRSEMNAGRCIIRCFTRASHKKIKKMISRK